jgi:WD40 repeat protein
LATEQLVRDELPPTTFLRDLGTYGLRGLVHTEHVYQLIAPDLQADFPPLKALDPHYVEPLRNDGTAVPNPYKGLQAFTEHDAAPLAAVGFNADQTQLVSVDKQGGPVDQSLPSTNVDRTVQIWDMRTAPASQLLTLYRHTGAIFDVAFSPEGTRLERQVGMEHRASTHCASSLHIAENRVTRVRTTAESQQYLPIDQCHPSDFVVRCL